MSTRDLIIGGLALLFCLILVTKVEACDEDDLTDISVYAKEGYWPCMSSGESLNWCKKGKKVKF